MENKKLNYLQMEFLKYLLISFLLVFLTGIFVAPAQENPHPKVVIPAMNKRPPSDAIVLFSKGNLDSFMSVNDKTVAPWKVKGKKFTVLPESGNIITRENFGDIQLHVEWRTPGDAQKFDGQKSGNSGIYLMGKYEVQVLNSWEKTTDPDRQAGSVYNQHVPLVNASFKPGKWQTYDIVFEAPGFDDKGVQTKAPYVTVFHNGVLIQNHVEILGPTTAYLESIPDVATEGPLMLQDHNNKVSYRNIWIRKL
jgi:hypothetical protein